LANRFSPSFDAKRAIADLSFRKIDKVIGICSVNGVQNGRPIEVDFAGPRRLIDANCL
jgi:hypothetical protein